MNELRNIHKASFYKLKEVKIQYIKELTINKSSKK